jgi:hypothetical protein
MVELPPLHPLEIVRECDGPKYFGYKLTQLRELIEKKVIPAPKLLGPPPSRARGWSGEQIIEYHRELEAKQAEREAAAKQHYDARLKPGKRKAKAKVARRAKART